MKWEYKILTLSGETENQQRSLNYWGKDGWELVSISPLPGSSFYYAHMKRQTK